MHTRPPSCRTAVLITTRVFRSLVSDISRDGSITVADVHRLIDLLERGTFELDQAYYAQQQACAEEQGKHGRIGLRNDPLQRLLVRPFEGMFSNDPPRFERKFLAVYFETTRRLIGPDYGALDSQCRHIIQGMLAIQGAHLTWDAFYADLRIIALLAQCITLIAERLNGPKGAQLWRNLMLKPAPDGVLPNETQLAEVREIILRFHHSLTHADGVGMVG